MRHPSCWNTQDTLRLSVRASLEVGDMSLRPSAQLQEFSPMVIARVKAYRLKGKFQQVELGKLQVSCECGNLRDEGGLVRYPV